MTRARVLSLARKARAMPPGQLAGIARTRLNNRFRALAWKRLGWTPARGRSVSPALAGQAAAAAARLLLGDRASELRSWLRGRPESTGRVVARAGRAFSAAPARTSARPSTGTATGSRARSGPVSISASWTC